MAIEVNGRRVAHAEHALQVPHARLAIALEQRLLQLHFKRLSLPFSALLDLLVRSCRRLEGLHPLLCRFDLGTLQAVLDCAIGAMNAEYLPGGVRKRRTAEAAPQHRGRWWLLAQGDHRTR